MATCTEQQLYLGIGRAYAEAIQAGVEMVQFNIETVADILEYLDGRDNRKARVHEPHQDDAKEGGNDEVAA